MRDVDNILGLNDKEKEELDVLFKKLDEKKELQKEMEEFNRKEEARARVNQGLKMIAQAVELIRG